MPTQEQVQVLPRYLTNTPQELEAENRGITEVQRDEDGTIIVDELDTDLDAWKRTLNAALVIQEKDISKHEETLLLVKEDLFHQI